MPYYNCTINAECNFDISHKGLLEECNKEENVEVNGAASAPCLPREL
jgi:hypothetical protein